MELRLRGRTVLVADGDDACTDALRAEGAEVVVSSLQDAPTHAAGVDAVVVYLPVAPSSLLDAGLADLREDWVQLEAVVAAFQAAVPSMTARGWGRLVTVVPSSVKALDDEADERGAVVGLAVLGMHKAVVADVARHGITTNAVLRDQESDPADVAGTVTFLLSEPAGYLQGVTLAVTGARTSSVF